MDIHSFTLYSNELGGNTPLRHVATAAGGENISPQLSWINAPKNAKSFAITIHDPNAPPAVDSGIGLSLISPKKHKTFLQELVLSLKGYSHHLVSNIATTMATMGMADLAPLSATDFICTLLPFTLWMLKP